MGYFLGLYPILGAAVFSVLTGLGIVFFSKKIKIREDAVIAMLWSFGMAIGIIFISITPGYVPNLMSYLFGNILTVSLTDLYLLIGLSLCVLLIFTIFYKTILFVAFDEEFSGIRRIPVSLINYLLIGMVSLTIVFNIKVMGIILILSLLTIPQSIAMLFRKNFGSIMIYSVFIACIGNLSGLFFSYLFDIPSGAAIIFSLVILYAMAKSIVGIRINIRTKKIVRG